MKEPTAEEIEKYDLVKAPPLLWEIWSACQLFRQMGFAADYIFVAFSDKTILNSEELDKRAVVVLQKPPYPNFTLVVGPFTNEDASEWPVFVEAVNQQADEELMASKFWASWARKHAVQIVWKIKENGIDIPAGNA